MPRALLASKWLHQRSTQVSNLASSWEFKAATLSGGNRQDLAL